MGTRKWRFVWSILQTNKGTEMIHENSRARHDTVKWRDIMIQTNRETDMTQANKGQRDNWVSLWKTQVTHQRLD